MNKLKEQKDKLEAKIDLLESKKQRLNDEIQRKKENLQRINMQIKVNEYETILKNAYEQGINIQDLLGLKEDL